MNKLLSLLFLSVLTSSWVFGQDFGGHPPNIKWKQINTDSVRVIFPEGMEKQAQRSASLIHHMYEHNLNSIGHDADKIDIVFRNQTTIPNGFVALPLFRSEFYTTPPSHVMISALDWNDALTIHEYRHVLQYVNARKGYGETAYWMTGEGGWAAFAGFFIPDWFFEGDAVVTETVLTDSGRGRTAHFNLDQRAILLNGKDYNYMKARNNSYKDMVPDHYQLGYVLSKYIRENYGDETWKKVIRDVTQMSGFVYPFSRNLEKYTGLTTRELYREAYDDLRETIQKEIDQMELTESEQLSVQRYKTFTNYRHPFLLENGDLIAVKSSFKEIPTIIRSSNGKEEKLVELGPTVYSDLTYHQGKLAWTELVPDARWHSRDYSVVATYDLANGRKSYLTSKSKYFSPNFSPNGQDLVVAEMDPQQKYKLKIIDASNGKTSRVIEHPENPVLRTPRWTEDGKGLITLAQNKNRLYWLHYSLQSNQWERLIAPTSHIMGGGFVKDNYLFFHASFSGIDNIYALELNSREVYQLTSVKIGAYHPSVSPDGKKLVFREYGSNGFEVRAMELDKALWKKIDIEEPNTMPQFAQNIEEADNGNILNDISPKNFSVEDYQSGLLSMKLHSWVPFATSTEAGINLLAENLLHTWQADLGAKYNFNDSVPIMSYSMGYGGFYPQLSAGVRVSTGWKANTNTDQEVVYDRYAVNGGVSLPLNLSKGAYQRYITSGVQVSHSLVSYRQDSEFNRSFSTIQPYVKIDNIKRRAYQLQKPRFGQRIFMAYQKELQANNYAFIATGRFFFPGIGITHNFYPELAYRKQFNEDGSVRFTDTFRYARGYSRPKAYDDVFLAAVNYQMPLFYPDFGFAGLVYLKRVRANLFGDLTLSRLRKEESGDQNPVGADVTLPSWIGLNNENMNQTMYRSAGLEVFFDTQWFNIRQAQLGVGVRASYLFDDPSFQFGGNASAGNFDPFSFQVVFQNIL